MCFNAKEFKENIEILSKHYEKNYEPQLKVDKKTGSTTQTKHKDLLSMTDNEYEEYIMRGYGIVD